jgi:molecular chaperone DnaK (HSP70)
MGVTVGIDLGTTNSALAKLDEHGRPVVVRNAENSPITPSVICFRDGEILVGDSAKEMQGLGDCPTAAFFKRQMGDDVFNFRAGDRDYSAVDLSALVLKKLKTDAEESLGEPVERAVITVPAYFRDKERKATIAAGEAAGLTVLQVINEPTAAAAAYGLNRSRESNRFLVYDLGGGTFDITLLELADGVVKVLSSSGDPCLGGKDWDDRIIQFLADSFAAEHGADPFKHAESVADLLLQAEEAKKQLTSRESTSVAIFHGGLRGRYQLDRTQFEALTADLMERTILLTRQIMKDAGYQPKDLNGILLVGGSTRMPMVRKFVEAEFGRPPMPGVNVDEAVALGAALVAAEREADLQPGRLTLPGIKTVDVTNHSLGMIAVNADETAYVNSIILTKNKTVPCQETRPYQKRTRRGDDNVIEVFMTQGETELPSEVVYTGKYVIRGVPHQNSGLAVVDITYHYDVSATISVTAKLRGASDPLDVTEDQLPSDLPERFLRPPPKPEAPQHVTVYLAFDLSGSMGGRPLKEAKKAAHGFLQNIDLGHCSMGVVAFSDRVLTKLMASQNAGKIEKAIDGLTVCETGIDNAAHPFDEILQLLKNVKGRRFAVVLADGVWSRQELAVDRARACHREEIDVIAVGFGGADEEFLKAIASADEAGLFTSMGQLVDTFSTIAQVLTESSGTGGQKSGFLAGLRTSLK